MLSRGILGVYNTSYSQRRAGNIDFMVGTGEYAAVTTYTDIPIIPITVEQLTATDTNRIHLNDILEGNVRKDYCLLTHEQIKGSPTFRPLTLRNVTGRKRRVKYTVDDQLAQSLCLSFCHVTLAHAQ